jgi:hypothetical protein
MNSFNKNLFELGNKLTSKKGVQNNPNSSMNQGNKSCKGAQSRNMTNNLINIKSHGAIIDSFSFIRPQSNKGDQGYDRQKKKNCKKSKNTKKMAYEEVKDGFFGEHPVKSLINHSSTDERNKRFSNSNKSAYK